MRKITFLLCISLINFSACSASDYEKYRFEDKDDHENNYQGKSNRKMRFLINVRDLTGRIMTDVGGNLYNLLSWDTFKVACATLPAYAIAKPFNHKIQKHFYNCETHKNIHQPSKVFSEIVMNFATIVIPIVGLRDICSRDTYHHRRAEVFFTGLALTWCTKNLFKLARTESNIRPWHEDFSHHKRAYGGNPSGHSALFGYVAAFWFAEEGPMIGVPLVLATGIGMGVAVVTNRHYLSQVILGAGYGAMFGLAAHRVLETTVFNNKNTKLGLVANPQSGLGLRLSCAF